MVIVVIVVGGSGVVVVYEIHLEKTNTLIKIKPNS